MNLQLSNTRARIFAISAAGCRSITILYATSEYLIVRIHLRTYHQIGELCGETRVFPHTKNLSETMNTTRFLLP